MSPEIIYTLHRLSKSYNRAKVLENINLSFFAGAKIGIVGENGAGKSTLLRIMSGQDGDFEGRAVAERNIRVGMIAQEPVLDPDKTVRETIEEAFESVQQLLQAYDDVTARMAEAADEEETERLMDRMGRLQDEIDAVDGWEIDRTLDRAADALVLPPDDMRVESLSGGERRRVALCRALLEKPDMLLLDEPTNHLDAETVDWLEDQLREYPGNVILVTHDRYFLDRITRWILELDHGHGIPFEGSYSSWLEQKIAAMAQSEKKGSERRMLLERELRWIRMSPEDRESLSRERVSGYEQMLAREKAVAQDATVIEIPPGPRLGDKVLEIRALGKSYGSNVLIDGLTLSLPRGAVVGILGPNGAGKTTLFRLIMGREIPDSGSIEVGETVEIAAVDQHRESLDPERTVWEEISEGDESIQLGARSVPSRNYVSRFNFRGTDQQKRVGSLSGGERNRVLLAKTIRRGGNLLLLDEPTNDLDISALRMLEDAINSYSGCAMIISHDRFFLDRVCTHLLVFEGEGKVRWFEGSYEHYEATRRQELGGDVYAKRRSRYRRI